MIIAVVSDIHSPKFFDQFVKSIENMLTELTKPQLFFLAGDIVDRGIVKEYRKIYNTLFGKINCPIIACFGNTEYGPETTDSIKQLNPEIKFLEDETLILDIEGTSVGIVGTKGSLDRPTFWQSHNIPRIAEQYRERIGTIDNLLAELKTDFKILLMHYTPTYKILEGENPWQYPELGSREMEKVVIERKPNLVICGHSHRGKKGVWLDAVPVINVGLMLNKGIVIIDTEKDLRPGLEKFF